MPEPFDVESLRVTLRSATVGLEPPDDLLVRARQREVLYRGRRQRRNRLLVVAGVAAVVGLVLVGSVLVGSKGDGTSEVVGGGQRAWLLCKPETSTQWRQELRGGWDQDGCTGFYQLSPSGGQEAPGIAKWTFYIDGLSLPAHCEVRVHIPDSPDANGAARYGVIQQSDDTTSIDLATVDQSRERGRWVQVGTAFQVPGGVSTLVLVLRPPVTGAVAAEGMRLLCDPG